MRASDHPPDRPFLLDFSPALEVRLLELTREWDGEMFERLDRLQRPAARQARRPEFA